MTATTTDFATAFRAIIGNIANRRARIGLSVHRLADGAVRFEHEPQIYFEGASTTKIPTVASALAALGRISGFAPSSGTPERSPRTARCTATS